jgi:glycosyltransferase involved in cell wall biosynthesis
VAVAPKMSLTESNGKLLNYMAMRLPVVAFDSAANRAIVGALGHLVPLGDADALADALLCALNDPTAVRDALRARIVDQFAWTERVRDLEAVYARLLGQAVGQPVDGARTAEHVVQLTPSSSARAAAREDT